MLVPRGLGPQNPNQKIGPLCQLLYQNFDPDISGLNPHPLNWCMYVLPIGYALESVIIYKTLQDAFKSNRYKCKYKFHTAIEILNDRIKQCGI